MDHDVRAVYRTKLKSAAEAVALLRSEDMLALPIATGEPAAFLTALGERQDFRALAVFGGLLTAPYPAFTHAGVRFISGFYGPIERMMRGAGANVDYLPADFLGWERYAQASRPRVVASALSPMDERGYLGFGLHAGATFHTFLQAARDPDRLAIGEVMRDMPQVRGIERFGGHRIHVSQIDCLIESDRSVFELEAQQSAEEDERIARYVEGLIAEGSTLQFGIGGIPNIVAQLLAHGRKGDFGIHTEMLVDGIMHLHRSGKVSNHKGVFDGYSIATFAAGSRALYEWMHRNPEVRMLPVAQVNDPAIIRRNRRMVSINGAIAIDLSGQVMADTIGPRQYSGVGGHELFVMGAGASAEGKSIICLHSCATVSGQRVSSIVAALPLGTAVTTPRHQVQYVVTEHGVADLAMLTARDRATALVRIAHPDFRPALEAALAVDGTKPPR
jgi:acyl-CoA hydrolase